jgi:type II secretory pathway pseudopilin PulG
MTLLEILIVLAILALVMGFLIGPRIFAAFQDSKSDVARMYVRKMAGEYTVWAAKPSNQGRDRCPTTQDLAEYVNQKPDFVDPWGNPYIIKCGQDLPQGARGIAIISRGEDGREGTGDDLKSWE